VCPEFHALWWLVVDVVEQFSVSMCVLVVLVPAVVPIGVWFAYALAL